MPNIFNKILVFDLDDTLIDTQAIKNILFNFAEKIGCGAEQNREIYQCLRDAGFTLEEYAAVLSEVVHKPAEEILSQMRTEIIDKKDVLVQKDTREFLELCCSMGVEMRLLTFGASDWQTEKLGMLGLDRYFHENRTTTNNEATGKLDELTKIVGEGTGDRVVLFNDKIKEIMVALKRFPEMTAYLRPSKQMDDELPELLEKMDPILRHRIEVLSDFKHLLPESYDGIRK